MQGHFCMVAASPPAWPSEGWVGSLVQPRIAEHLDHGSGGQESGWQGLWLLSGDKHWWFLSRGLTAACQVTSVSSRARPEPPSRRHRRPMHAAFASALHWANGSKAPSGKRMAVCSVPSRPPLGSSEKDQIPDLSGSLPNPVIGCSYFHTRVWGNMHLLCQITQKDGRPIGSISKLHPAVPKLSAVSFFY